MRIAYIIHSLHHSGGMERVLSVKANWLSAQPGHEVFIIATNLRGRRPAFELRPEVRVLDLGMGNVDFKGLRRRLDGALNEIRPDITVSLSGKDIFALPKCTDGSCKMAEFHFSLGKFYCKYGKSIVGRWYAGLRTRRLISCVQKLSAFVVLTKKDQQAWMPYVSSVKQIYNPLTFCAPSKSATDSRKMIAVGRLEPQKNFSDLILAWAKALPGIEGWSLEIYGDGKEKEKLQELINSLGVESSVTLAGRTGDVAGKMVSSSAFLMTSSFEGFPLALLEASECGLPLISYDCPDGPSEIIKDGVNGYLVGLGDVDAMASRIVKLANDSSLRKKMGAEASGMAKVFSMENIMSQWDALFKSLV